MIGPVVKYGLATPVATRTQEWFHISIPTTEDPEQPHQPKDNHLKTEYPERKETF